MLIGLILAAREIKRSTSHRANVSPIVYLRSDIWEQIDFSDKNKITRTSTTRLFWDESSLQKLIDERLSAKLGVGAVWENVEDGAKMRGAQPKLQHIFSRTLLRPRDVIQFLNEALAVAKMRTDEPSIFTNEDINGCRDEYSHYLKSELDDEIVPHWPQWTEALQACAKTQTITFKKEDFLRNYEALKSDGNPYNAETALEQLYRFSVVGFLQPSGGGGSTWSFRYADNKLGWDSTATRLKVHTGLKEYAKLKEERSSR